VRLFERVGRRVALTDAGATLRDGTEHPLLEIKRARQRMLDLARLRSGQLVVGVMPGRGFLWLPGFLDAFMQSHPLLNFRLMERSTTELIKLLEAGEIHTACISIAKGSELPRRIAFQEVDSGELAIVVHPDHPMAPLHSVSVGQLAHQSLLLATREETARLMLDEALLPLGFQANVRFESNDPLTLIRLAGRGLGIAVTFARHGQTAQAESVVTIPFKPRRSVSFGVAWSQDRGPHVRAVRTFVDFFSTWWREHPEEHPVDRAALLGAGPNRMAMPNT
jgi:DNA-binding transcriptional LysR family regulator